MAATANFQVIPYGVGFLVLDLQALEANRYLGAGGNRLTLMEIEERDTFATEAAAAEAAAAAMAPTVCPRCGGTGRV